MLVAEPTSGAQRTVPLLPASSMAIGADTLRKKRQEEARQRNVQRGLLNQRRPAAVAHQQTAACGVRANEVERDPQLRAALSRIFGHYS